MRVPEDIANKIDQYLNGELSGSELTSFENQIASDPNLAKEVELQEMVNDALFDNGLLDYKEKISSDLKKINKKKSWTKIGLVGIGLASIGLLSYIFWPVDEVEKYKEEAVEVQNINKDSVVKIATHSQDPPATDQSYLDHKVLDQIEKPKTITDSIVADSTSSETINEYPLTDTGNDMPIVMDPCEDVNITARIETDEPCNDEKTGILKFTEFKGGLKPYRCTIDKSKAFASTSTFNYLQSGTYYLAIQDANGCESVINKNFTLESRECIIDHAPVENTFTPVKGFSPDFEKWVYEDSKGRNFDLQIYNKKGELIKEFNLATLVEWDGTNNSNQRVETGLYVYIVKIEGLPTEKGTVTVMN